MIVAYPWITKPRKIMKLPERTINPVGFKFHTKNSRIVLNTNIIIYQIKHTFLLQLSMEPDFYNVLM